jgi:hypothetical protein
MIDEGDNGAKDVEFSGAGLGDRAFVLKFRATKVKVRDLVAKAVEEFVHNQIAAGMAVARKPRRQKSTPMSPQQIREDSRRGAVGARRGPREIDPVAEVAKATRALRGRRIRVFVDGVEMESPDAEVTLAPWTKVVFVRALRSGGVFP